MKEILRRQFRRKTRPEEVAGEKVKKEGEKKEKAKKEVKMMKREWFG